MSRVGNFSSSQIYRLMSKGRGNWSPENVGAPFNSYVREKQWERRLGRPLNGPIQGRPAIWGSFVEKFVYDQQSGVVIVSKDRWAHPEIEGWTGSPDYFRPMERIVGDIKCPWTLTSFCEMVDLIEGGVEEFKAKKPEYYWQLVSNLILTGFDQCELTVFVPTLEQLMEIRELAEQAEFHDNDHWAGELNPDKVAFIPLIDHRELPFLPEDSQYNSTYTLRFTPPEEDIENLTKRVQMAVKQL